MLKNSRAHLFVLFFLGLKLLGVSSSSIAAGVSELESSFCEHVLGADSQPEHLQALMELFWREASENLRKTLSQESGLKNVLESKREAWNSSDQQLIEAMRVLREKMNPSSLSNLEQILRKVWGLQENSQLRKQELQTKERSSLWPVHKLGRADITSPDLESHWFHSVYRPGVSYLFVYDLKDSVSLWVVKDAGKGQFPEIEKIRIFLGDLHSTTKLQFVGEWDEERILLRQDFFLNKQTRLWIFDLKNTKEHPPLLTRIGWEQRLPPETYSKEEENISADLSERRLDKTRWGDFTLLEDYVVWSVLREEAPEKFKMIWMALDRKNPRQIYSHELRDTQFTRVASTKKNRISEKDSFESQRIFHSAPNTLLSLSYWVGRPFAYTLAIQTKSSQKTKKSGPQFIFKKLTFAWNLNSIQNTFYRDGKTQFLLHNRAKMDGHEYPHFSKGWISDKNQALTKSDFENDPNLWLVPQRGNFRRVKYLADFVQKDAVAGGGILAISLMESTPQGSKIFDLMASRKRDESETRVLDTAFQAKSENLKLHLSRSGNWLFLLDENSASKELAIYAVPIP